MSAFICNNQTYANIYSGMQVFYHPSYSNTQRAIGELLDSVSTPFLDIDHHATALAALYAVNVEAINLRYNENNPTAITNEELKEMCHLQPALSPYQFVKSLECLHYQMCEGNIPETSKLYPLIGKLISAVCTDIAHTSKLYSEAKWG